MDSADASLGGWWYVLMTVTSLSALAIGVTVMRAEIKTAATWVRCRLVERRTRPEPITAEEV